MSHDTSRDSRTSELHSCRSLVQSLACRTFVGLRAGDSTTPLRREWPAYNPIGNCYLEMVVAPDALNPLVAHLCESSMGGNMNLLLGLTELAFHRHDDIGLVGHRGASTRGSTAPRISVSRYCPAFFEGIACQWKRQFSLLPQAISRLSTKTSGTRLTEWRRKIPNLLLMPVEVERNSLGSCRGCSCQQLQPRAFPCTLIQSCGRGPLSGVRHPGTTLPRQVELVFSLVPYSGSHQGHLLFLPPLSLHAPRILPRTAPARP
jgi:hypothetical protein